MEKIATLSTIISAPVKKAALTFCKRKGVKLRHFVEQALVEQLEDEIDFEAYQARRSEETIPLEDILNAGSKRKK